MSEVEIIAIRKDGGNHYNENEAITDLRWINHFNKKIGESTRASMIRYIKEGNHAYVSSGIKKHTVILEIMVILSSCRLYRTDIIVITC